MFQLLAQKKMSDRRGSILAPYSGMNLQSSRTPSAINTQCHKSYEAAKRNLRSSRSRVRHYNSIELLHRQQPATDMVR